MAQKSNRGITAATMKSGMNKDTHPSLLQEQEYSHALNTNIQNESGDFLLLTNEHSNILASKFKDGFEVIGFENDLYSNNTYFLLVNSQTGVGELGQIKDTQTVTNLEDLTISCKNCDEIRDLAKPLEDIVQQPSQIYETILSDELAYDSELKTCFHYTSIEYKNKKLGFNFNKYYPIKSIVIKNEKCGKNMYFSDGLNPPRHINLTNIQDYYVKKLPCSTDIVNRCIDFDDLRIFKLYNIPKLVESSLQLGGQLKLGVYEFMIAYCDAIGNEISPYFSVTRPISIFDKNNRILTQPEIADRTNFSIRLEAKDLDDRYSYYKVVAIQTADIEGVVRYFIEGVHPINDRIVVYGTEQGKLPISEVELLARGLDIDTTEGVTTNMGRLYQYGLTLKKEINLQPVVNLMGQFLKWQTHIAPENLYENGLEGARYIGYNRDEVVPFGIRFILDGGYETAVFPFIGRAPKSTDLVPVAQRKSGSTMFEALPGPTFLDVKSILENSSDCNSTNRTKKWQYYNTATVYHKDSICGNPDEDIKYTTVTEEVSSTCIVPNMAIVPSGNISVSIDNQEYTTLQDYIAINSNTIAECQSVFTGFPICSYLEPAQYTNGYDCPNPVFEELDCPTINSSFKISVESIEGLKEEKIPKPFPSSYAKVVAPQNCIIHNTEINDSGNQAYIQDPDNPLGYSGTSTNPKKVYIRASDFANESCTSAKEIPLLENPSVNYAEGSFFNYYFAPNQASLVQAKSGLAVSTGFTTNLHKGALWFRGLTEGNNEFIVDISRQRNASSSDDLPTTQKVRVSIFKSCSDTSPIFSYFVDLVTNSGDALLFKRGTTNGQFNQNLTIVSHGNLTPITTIPNGWVGTSFYVAVDCPIQAVPIDIIPGIGSSIQTTYLVTPTKGCFTVTRRPIQYSEVKVSWDKMTLQKEIEYVATCNFQQPIIQACKAIPFKKGDFAYWESEETYPNNSELFNSEFLKILPNQIPNRIKTEFESTFTSGNVAGGAYIFKEEIVRNNRKSIVDFRCRNIRHFKFPDNKIAPFMSDNPQTPFSQSIIYPLGVTIDEDVIAAFLDIAVSNNLISGSDRAKIKRYEIFRGDIEGNRSIIASGLLYDMRKYRESGKVNKDVLYSNYPFNSYNDDILNLPIPGLETVASRRDLGQTAVWGESNRHYTFHSPETDYSRPLIPSELNVQGYMFGSSRGHFDQVLEHPKWVILTPRARNLAATLASVEVAVEASISAFQALANTKVDGGVSTTIYHGGPVAFFGLLALQTLSGVVFKYGRYRYAWLKIFKDLGTPHNFASYYFGEGNYNFIKTPQQEGNIIRGINSSRYLQEGRFVVTNETTGEVLNINNIDRERSVFLTIGNNKLSYPNSGYKLYDKRNTESSLTYESLANSAESGRSREIIRRIASPYIALKNYLPAQYGTLSSVKWLTTSYIGDFSKRGTCLSIFGGDTFISRHSLKRKIPLFLVTAMKQADLIPFNYFFYNNIGTNPKFYCSYEVDKDFQSSSTVFPDIDSDFVFDNQTKRTNYFIPPSKFYLYYYGIPSFLTETRINTNFRYAGKEFKENFYPLVGDLGEWTQETNISIKEPNFFRYNNTYSKKSFIVRNRVLKNTFDKVFDNCVQDMPNGIICSLPDNSEQARYDPWLIFKPLDTFELPSEYGKLKDVISIGNEEVLARFSDTSIVYNRVDTKIDNGAEIVVSALGGRSIFQRRSTSLSTADLGHAGTQNFAKVTCEFGNFWVDAKRGQVLSLPPGNSPIAEISNMVGGKSANMRNWFKEHLPFKILKSIPNADIDNPYTGVGITMGWDSRHRRVFITKKDYIPKSKCIKYVDNEGFFYNQTECEQVSEQETICPKDYSYNPETKTCVRQYSISNLCPPDYVYDLATETCRRTIREEAVCTCNVDVTASPMVICSGEPTKIPIFSSVEGATFTWTVSSNGVTGAEPGSGDAIVQELFTTGISQGEVTYTITPKGPDGCIGSPLSILVIVKPVPTIEVEVDAPTIESGDTVSILISSDLPTATFTWTAEATGVFGASDGSGNLIQQVLTGFGQVVYTITPISGTCPGLPKTVIIRVGSIPLTDTTQINIWFDNSGSMGATMLPLATMRDSILKSCLLPYYNNDETLYNNRVQIRNFSDNPNSIERYIKLMAVTSTNPNITRVINLAFQDESSPYGAEVNYPLIVLSNTAEDVANLRAKLDIVTPNSLLGAIFQVNTGPGTYPGFRSFVKAMHESPGVAPYTGINGLSDRPEIEFKLDVVASSTPTYYANLIISTLNNLGYNLQPC